MERVLFAPRELPPLPPDAAHEPERYEGWVSSRERERQRSAAKAHHPRLDLVMLVTDAAAAAPLRRTLNSLRAQTSGHWTLTLAVPAPRVDEVGAVVRAGLPRRLRRQVRWVATAEDAPLPERLREAVLADSARPLALLFPGDVWAPDAVAQLGGALTPTGVVYADEDQITAEGTHRAPVFKPDYSPDYLVSSRYTGRPLGLGSALVGELTDLAATDLSALEHECALLACRAAESVLHVSEVLCHRSDLSPPGTDDTYLRHFLEKTGEEARVQPGERAGTFRVSRGSARDDVVVSIVIPFRDQPRFLRTCVDSIRSTVGGERLEFVLIDNGSTDPETQTLVETLERAEDVQVLRDARSFNWAALNNAGAQRARGDVLLFLNNDIEARQSGWLDALRGHALRPDVGAVGARLLYPDARVQHCGVVIGMGGAAGHPLAGLPAREPGYLAMATVTRECAAVTGACLATRRAVFDGLGGFDESLGVDLNDIDFCLRAAALGYRTVFEPAAELTHHESPSRGTAGGVGDILRFVERWREYITQGDRYFSPHLTRIDSSCGLARAEEEDVWNQWYSTVTQM
ncbi:MAG TPA: glycosyltransferase family 2 protein [Acidimicrobiales bacterium]|nr:glycosyltransferase family 2 protein [Acidimicrobiales bacterium]